MAISDVGTLLYHSATGASNSFTSLVSIKDAPATGSAPGKLEMTTLDMTVKGYIADRLDVPDMEFTYNYTEAELLAVQAVATGATHYFLIVYGDNSGVKITGQARTWRDALSLGSVATCKLNIVASNIEDETIAETAALTLGS